MICSLVTRYFSVQLNIFPPAAEFLAREHEQLGDLETEIGPLTGEDNGHSYPILASDCDLFHITSSLLAVSPHKSPMAVVEKKVREVRKIQSKVTFERNQKPGIKRNYLLSIDIYKEERKEL